MNLIIKSNFPFSIGDSTTLDSSLFFDTFWTLKLTVHPTENGTCKHKEIFLSKGLLKE